MDIRITDITRIGTPIIERTRTMGTTEDPDTIGPEAIVITATTVTTTTIGTKPR